VAADDTDATMCDRLARAVRGARAHVVDIDVIGVVIMMKVDATSATFSRALHASRCARGRSRTAQTHERALTRVYTVAHVVRADERARRGV